MRTNIVFLVTGTSKSELENKLKQRLSVFLNVEPEEVEDLADVEMFITVGEESELQLTFTADCRVRIR
jgi:hypothetical protein